MKIPKLVVTTWDEPIAELVRRSDHKILAVWAADCAERVLPDFEKKYPGDNRPRKALEALRTWIQTGVFKMADICRDALAAHAAAREVTGDNVARSAARAAGQALATAHVSAHSLAASRYAATAIRDATDSIAAATKEREWQYRHLVKLGNKNSNKSNSLTENSLPR